MGQLIINDELHARVSRFATVAGYSRTEEFVEHVLEKELSSIDDSESEEEVKKRLQELGYLA